MIVTIILGVIKPTQLANLVLHLSEVNEILQLCLFMGLSFPECEKIQIEHNDINVQKIVLIHRWYEGAPRMWNQFIRALAMIKKCKKAAELARDHMAHFSETDDAVLSCPSLRRREL